MVFRWSGKKTFERSHHSPHTAEKKPSVSSMRAWKAKNLSSFFLSTTTTTTSPTNFSSTSTSAPFIKTLELPNLFTPHRSRPFSKLSDSFLRNSFRVSSKSKSKKSSKSSSTTTTEPAVSLSSSLKELRKRRAVESEKDIFTTISGILGGSEEVLSSQVSATSNFIDDELYMDNNVESSWNPNSSNSRISDRHKVKSRGRKEKWIFKNTQSDRFQKMVTACGKRLGTDATLEVFGRLQRETGQKEYKALIKLCVNKARDTQDEDISLNNIHRAYQLLRAMKEQGFQVENDIYGPVLSYLVDMRMVEEFYFFCELINEGNSSIHPKFGYYEMLLLIKIDDEEKIQELCSSIVVDGDANEFYLAENYLMALCETDKKKELLHLLEVIDVTKISSSKYLSSIFESIGRLLLEESADKLILALKASEVEVQNLSYFICDYAINMPKLAVEDVITKFEDLHEKYDVRPSSSSYEKLIVYCCQSYKVHAAFSIVEQMCRLDMALPVEILYPIIHAVDESCELDLVHPIYSVIRRYNLKPKGEVLRDLIHLHVKIKDFEGAYNMLGDLKEMNICPTSSMYNAILAGYFREKNFHSGEMVLSQMKRANVKPDSRTFSYLIGNSESEKDVIKYYEEMQSADVHVTKHVYMALINAYVRFGQFEKAKQVILDKRIPVKNLNEMKSVLVSALSSSGQMPDALKLYDEIKQDGWDLEPKAVISLIEHMQSEGELDRLLQLLQELKYPDDWFDGCGRVVLYCVRNKHLSSAVDLLKQLKDQDKMSTYAVLDQTFCEIFDMEPKDLQMGLDLVLAVKEELELCPSRTSLDFLLSACVSAKDTVHARLILEEYEKAGLPYNVLTYMRMYQLHLACGERKVAQKILRNIPKDDPHVKHIIKACDLAFSKSKSKKEKRQ